MSSNGHIGSDFRRPPAYIHIARRYAVVDLGAREQKHLATVLPVLLSFRGTSVTSSADGRPFIQITSYCTIVKSVLWDYWKLRGKGSSTEEPQRLHLWPQPTWCVLLSLK